MPTTYLDFEKPIAELETKIAELESLTQTPEGPSITDELKKLKDKATKQLKDTYSSLSPWRKTQVARHPERPHFSDYIESLFDDFQELAGDRVFGNDEAVIGGMASFRGKSVIIMGHEKGRTTESRLRHNFGMAHPEGYRKAVRLMDLADKFKLPVLTFVDTAGAFPGKAGEERGHEMVFYNIKDCYMKLDDEMPEVHYRGGHIVNGLDAVIPRIRPSATFYGCALTRQFESMGVYVQNSSLAISQSRDKLFSLQLLIKSGLDIPLTGFANSPIDTNELIDMVGGAPLIVKLLEGSQGRGVVLAETKKAAQSVINAFKAVKANLLVQEFVKEAGGKDLRLFVINGKVKAAIQRTAAPGEFRANIHQGGSASVVRPSPEERRLAIKAAKAMGLAVAGVDLIRSKTGPLLLEVNSSPGLEGIESATEKDVAGMMIAAIEHQLKWDPNAA